MPINGRDALPVRALCLVAGYKRLSPDVVAGAARGEGHYSGKGALPTYQLIDGVVQGIDPAHWVIFDDGIRSSSLLLQAQGPSLDATRDQWRYDATKRLPAGVFVWLDEFQDWFRRTRPYRAEEGKTGLQLELPEEGGLTLTPPIADGLKGCLLEGFPLASTQPAPPTPKQPVSAVADREELARLRAEAEARRQEDERKAAEGRAAEEARLATERAEIARQEAIEAEARRIEQAQHQGDVEAVTQEPESKPIPSTEQAASKEDQGNVGPAQTIGPALPTARTHRLKSRVHALDAVIELAKQQAINPTDYQSTWAALVKIAESECPPPLCGYSSDGIQYKGKEYEKAGIPDVFSKNALRMKMKRSAR